jgi:hypothetical protein
MGLYEDDSSRLKMAGSFVNGSGSANLYGQAYGGAHNAQYQHSNDLYGVFLVKIPIEKSQRFAVSANAPSSFSAWLLPLCMFFMFRSKKPN